MVFLLACRSERKRRGRWRGTHAGASSRLTAGMANVTHEIMHTHLQKRETHRESLDKGTVERKVRQWPRAARANERERECARDG